MKKILMYGALAFLCMGMAACDDCDPVAEQPVAPSVTKAPNTISGVITDMQGNPVAGATVKVGNKTATTNSQGVYVISDIAAGTYAVSVSANGLVSQESEIVLASSDNTQNYTWSAALANAANVANVNVTVANGGDGEVESEAIKGNDKGEIEIAVEVPAQTVPENTNIYMTPLYEAEDAASRAAAEEMLIGATLSCSKEGLVLSQPIDLKFAVDPTVSETVVTKQYVNGRWEVVNHEVKDGNVVISAREFTSYGLFFPVEVSLVSGFDAITFARSEWNNFNGTSPMTVATDATYDYNVGIKFETRAANNLEGLLIEFLARQYGSTSVVARGAYPLNLTLPIGTALNLKGDQAYDRITARGAGRSVSAKHFGVVSVAARTTVIADHEGGSNAGRL